jgi:hypothetical protein
VFFSSPPSLLFNSLWGAGGSGSYLEGKVASAWRWSIDHLSPAPRLRMSGLLLPLP